MRSRSEIWCTVFWKKIESSMSINWVCLGRNLICEYSHMTVWNRCSKEFAGTGHMLQNLPSCTFTPFSHNDLLPKWRIRPSYALRHPRTKTVLKAWVDEFTFWVGRVLLHCHAVQHGRGIGSCRSL